MLAALATEREAAAANLAPGLIQTSLGGSLRGIGGSPILGSGEVALILDVPALAQLAADASAPPPSAARLLQP